MTALPDTFGNKVVQGLVGPSAALGSLTGNDLAVTPICIAGIQEWAFLFRHAALMDLYMRGV